MHMYMYMYMYMYTYMYMYVNPKNKHIMYESRQVFTRLSVALVHCRFDIDMSLASTSVN